MKKLFVLLVAVVAMMVCNPVMGQETDPFVSTLDKLDQNAAKECWTQDLNTYMYAKGYSDKYCSSESVAVQSALEHCRRDLTERIEQLLDGAIDEAFTKFGISQDSEESNGRRTEITSSFHRSLKKSLGALDRCYISVTTDQRGDWHCVYYGRLPKEEFKKALDEDSPNTNKGGVDTNKLKEFVYDKITSEINNNIENIENN